MQDFLTWLLKLLVIIIILYPVGQSFIDTASKTIIQNYFIEKIRILAQLAEASENKDDKI